MSDKTPPYSSHIFMFPFRFDWNEDGFDREYFFYKEKNITDRIAIRKLHEKLTQDKDWEYKAFKVADEYNEYSYFYDYARDAIYNFSEEFDEDAISYYYEKNQFKNEIFELKIKERKESYQLTLAGVTLRVFNSGVAILSLELENHIHLNFDDILKINDFGRRIYPQFIGKDNGIEDTKDAFLAEYIKIGEIEERFEYENFDNIRIGSHIMQLLGQTIFTQDKKQTERYYIRPSLDDRMFVISWYGNSAKSTQLKQDYLQNDSWYKYVFVDGKYVTVKNRGMQKELLKKSTYDRWSDDGMLFGISRYSFVSITNRDWFPLNIIQPHIGTMYFQMITLLLATRSSLLRFSNEIAVLASHQQIDTQKLTILYQRYLTFSDRLYFNEVTHQDQGIELYDMARNQMKIDEHIEKLNGKFSKLFEFAELQDRKRVEAFEKKKFKIEKEIADKRANAMDNFTIMGAIFLPPSLMIALFSMGIFEYEQSFNSLIIGVISIVCSALLTIGILNFKKPINKKKIISAITIAIATLLFVLIPFRLIGEKTKPNDVNITNPIIKVEIKK